MQAASDIFWYALHCGARSTDWTRGLLLHSRHARSFVRLIYSLTLISFLPFLFLRLHPHFLFLILLLILFLFPVLLLVSSSSSCSLLIFITYSSSSSQFINLFSFFAFSPQFPPFQPFLLSFFLLILVPFLFHHLPHAPPSPLCGYCGCYKQNSHFFEISSPRSDNTKIKVSWDVTPCSLVHRYELLNKKLCIRLQDFSILLPWRYKWQVHPKRWYIRPTYTTSRPRTYEFFTPRYRDLQGFFTSPNIRLVVTT